MKKTHDFKGGARGSESGTEAGHRWGKVGAGRNIMKGTAAGDIDQPRDGDTARVAAGRVKSAVETETAADGTDITNQASGNQNTIPPPPSQNPQVNSKRHT